MSPAQAVEPRPFADVAPIDLGAPNDREWAPPLCEAGCDLNCVDRGRYVEAGGIAYDRTTGLFWQTDPGPQLLFSDADDRCANLSTGWADSGWRLPTDAELSSILYKPGGLKTGAGTCQPAIDQAAFPATRTDYYWTAYDGNVRPMAINFFDGRGHRLFPDTGANTRCVHDPVASPTSGSPN